MMTTTALKRESSHPSQRNSEPTTWCEVGAIAGDEWALELRNERGMPLSRSRRNVPPLSW